MMLHGCAFIYSVSGLHLLRGWFAFTKVSEWGFNSIEEEDVSILML